MPVTGLLVEGDGGQVAAPHAQADMGQTQVLLGGGQQHPPDAAAAVFRLHADGGDPAAALGRLALPGGKADHAAIDHRFQADNVGEGQHAKQIDQRPGVFAETNLLQFAQFPQVAQRGCLDFKG